MKLLINNRLQGFKPQQDLLVDSLEADLAAKQLSLRASAVLILN